VFALILVMLGATGEALAEPPASAFVVLAPDAEGPRITPYLSYQIDMAWRQDERRRARFAAIHTEAELQQVQADLRAKLLRALGGLPSTKTPLNPQVTGRIQMTGYHIEKVVFESLPGVVVTALVYVPDQPGKHPAVLVPCGHSTSGKAYYQAICQRLAARGYVVICWDPVGQGERSQFWDASRQRSRYNLICGEHAVLGNLAYLAGTSLARWEVWDGMRAVDYVLTRPEVDPAHVSITGTSGGGFQAAIIAALDTRINAAAPSCYITALPMRVANRIFMDPDADPEQDPYGMIADGIDHAGLLLLMYPRPVFVAAAVLDFFPIEGARSTFREISAIYRRFGHGDRIGMTEGYHKHEYSVENQAAAFAFLDRFNGITTPSVMAPTTILDNDAVRCTKTGQVLLDHPDGRSVMDEIRDYYRAHAGTPATPLGTSYYGAGYPGIAGWTFALRQAQGERKQARGERKQAQGERKQAQGQRVEWESAGTSVFDGVAIDKYVLHHSGGLVMPLLHLHREGVAGTRTMLWISDHGKASAADWAAMQKFLADGYDVVTFDGRGLGETRMRYRAVSEDDPTLVAGDFDSAYVSPLSSVLADYVYNTLLTGRPYLLQMIEDVEIAARFARTHLNTTDVSITAEGDAYTLAHDAAGVLKGARLVPNSAGRLLSWSDVVSQKREIWPVQYVYPAGAYLR
jgi:cephalosporin-C deacetylase-like acetyl esterase